ncbi:MAG: M16 family metallopeptidase, partial [Gemmatimonadales bacterium]
KLDSPSALTHETLNQVLFDQHRIRRWRIGTEAQLAGYLRDDVHGYYRERYVPARTVVSVVGGVPTEAALAAVAEAFAGWESRPGHTERSPEEPEREGVRVRTLRGDVKQAELELGWRGAPELAADTPALDVAAMVLSSGRGSWLYRRLRQPGLVTAAWASHFGTSDVGVFSIGAELRVERIDEAIRQVASLVRGLAERGPSAADLQRAKTLLASRVARRHESVDGRATAFATAESFGGLDQLNLEYERLMAVTADQVRDVAARYLRPSRIAAVAYLPHDQGADLDALQIEAAFTHAEAGEKPAVRAPVGLAVPAPRRVQGRESHGVLHVALPGADLLIRCKATVPLVTTGIYRTRVAEETAADAGIAALALRSAMRGAGNFDAADLADVFEAWGGTLGNSIGADWLGIGVSVLPDATDRAARLLREVLWHPTFAPDEVHQERETLVREALQTGDDMFRRPIDLALGAGFGDRGYGLPLKGSVESLEAMDASHVRTWHGRELTEGRPLVLAVGGLDPEAMADRLAGIFDDLPSRSASVRREAAAASRSAEPRQRVESRSKAQTALAMVFPGPCATDTDRHAVEVLAAVASGLGGRLFHRLREERSLAYTVMMSSWQRARAGALVTYIATSPSREDEARDAMLAELARFRDELVSETEHERAVNYLIGQTLVQRQTAGALAGEIVHAWLVGRGLDELEDPAAPYREVTREAVRTAAARYLIPELRAEGVVRGGQGG